MTYTPFRHIDSVFWKHSPIHLTFFLTRRCNARCPFCFYLGKKNAQPREGINTGSPAGDYEPVKSIHNSDELTLQEIEKISLSFGKLLWLAFSGGEIFLRSDIAEITKVFYKNTKPSIILFPTNGLLTDTIRGKIEEILTSCRKSTIVVKLSLEGTEFTHDTIRGAKGSFGKTMDTYRALGELLEQYPNFELGINTVFCSTNQDHMDDLIAFVQKLDKVKTHTVSLIRGEVADTSLKTVDVGKYEATIKKLESNLKRKQTGRYRFRGARLKAAQDILQRRLIHETLCKKKEVIPCYAGKLNLVLTERGDVYPCESFSGKMGNVRDTGYDIQKLLKTDKAKGVIHSIQSNGCYCTHECYFMTNILFNPRMYPSLLKEYIMV
jgi:radical SAM protein with 4Fe4S-binding SPASM domain